MHTNYKVIWTALLTSSLKNTKHFEPIKPNEIKCPTSDLRKHLSLQEVITHNRDLWYE